MKINLGFNNRRYTRDMSFDNNTTYSFGEVQPLMSQFMLPDSDIKVSGKSLVRLSPLKVPSFARVHLEMISRFVPVTDVFSPFESLLSNIPYSHNGKTFTPNCVPAITSNLLMLVLITRSSWTLYDNDKLGSPSVFPVSNQTLLNTLNTSLQSSLLGYSLPVAVPTPYGLQLGSQRTETSASGGEDESISIEGADYVINFTSSTHKHILALRLNSYGLRLRKIFIGLGYDPLSEIYKNSDFLKVDILPLLAFYKAYFETYYPTRFISFINTSCFNLIDYFSGSSDNAFTTSAKFQNISAYFAKFMIELQDCFYASPDDYISIHTSSPLNSANDSHLSFYGNGLDLVEQTSGGLPVTSNGGEVDSITSVMLRSIRLFTNFVSKDSVIGQRMSDWVRQHFNADVANQLFKDSNFVGRYSLPLQISDVFSTSDTAQGSGDSATGESLGAYAGKGIGFGDYNFKFHAPVHGYFFIFACIVPDSRTFQGVDPTLLALTRFELPQPEFDALGYELTDRRVFIPTNDIQPSEISSSSVSFGFVPRYTGFKYKKNIVNGDMSRRSTMDTFSPYYLDRIITQNTVDKSGIVWPHSIPSASPNWRFTTRYGYLGDFDRLFIYENQIDPESDVYHETIDNFLSQTIFSVSVTDSLKPLKSSYDTISEDDNNVKSVNAE